MPLPAQYEAAAAFESYLGDPADPASRIPFASALELDEREEYPFAAHRELDRWRLPEMYIPAACGGKLDSFEEVLALLRVLARRDLTVALTHAITFLGALPVWIAGSDDRKRTTAELIRGGGKIAFALTERMHGADLLASDFEAREAGNEGDGYVVSGEKWLIGNATRAEAIVLFAKTRAEGGPRGFSLLFAEKRLFDPATFHHVPKAATVGLRGADISGIAFERCAMPAAALIGRAGSGLELALKTLQITRTLVTGLSLAAADTALRLAVDFAFTRRIYGAAVFEIPHARAVLSGAFLDLTICDCVATCAARALHVCPDQASVWSAATKYFVPATLDSSLREMAGILGARFFLRSGHEWSMFQKIARDSSIVGVFEGTSVVQLHALGLQLEQLVDPAEKIDSARTQRLEAIFSLAAPLGKFDARQMDLISRDGGDAVHGIPWLCAELRMAEVGEAAMRCVELVALQYRELIADIAASTRLAERSTARLELARRYTHLHAAACCIGFWIHNRETAGDFLAGEAWLCGCLNRLSGDAALAADAGVGDWVSRELIVRYREHRLFSVVPFQLPRHELPRHEGESINESINRGSFAGGERTGGGR